MPKREQLNSSIRTGTWVSRTFHLCSLRIDRDFSWILLYVPFFRLPSYVSHFRLRSSFIGSPFCAQYLFSSFTKCIISRPYLFSPRCVVEWGSRGDFPMGFKVRLLLTSVFCLVNTFVDWIFYVFKKSI